jgi:hypothetical protein
VSSLVLDAGALIALIALIALDRNDRDVWAILRVASDASELIQVPAGRSLRHGAMAVDKYFSYEHLIATIRITANIISI